MNKKPRHRKVRKKGMSPGTLVYTGQNTAAVASVKTIWFSETELLEKEYYHPDFLKKEGGITWIDVRGLTDTNLIARIGSDLQIHSLALEDVLDTQQRPKLEEYENGLFLILTNFKLAENAEDVHSEQIAIFIGKDFVVSFQEDIDDTFSNIRQRILEGRGRIRKKGSDYLAYTLMDTIVDHYYLIHDQIELEMDEIETKLHNVGIDHNAKSRIYQLKRMVSAFRRQAVPMRDAVTRFYRTESAYIDESNRLYFRDVSDHVAQILDGIENSRDSLLNIQEFFQSEAGNQLNNVMRLLTVISTIFIPLSFIASVYGMNFDYMPGLQNHYGFFILSGVMLCISLGMLYYFKRQRWM